MRTALLLTALSLVTASCAGGLPAAAPTCDATNVLALEAQSVPTAGNVPCLTELPAGWTVGLFSAGDAGTRWGLDHAIGGRGAVIVDIASRCSGADGTSAGEPPPDVVDELEPLDPVGLGGRRLVPLDGACATVWFDLPTDGWRDVVLEFDAMFTTVAREQLADELRRASDGRLDLERSGG